MNEERMNEGRYVRNAMRVIRIGKLIVFEQKPDLLRLWICTVQLYSTIDIHAQWLKYFNKIPQRIYYCECFSVCLPVLHKYFITYVWKHQVFDRTVIQSMTDYIIASHSILEIGGIGNPCFWKIQTQRKWNLYTHLHKIGCCGFFCRGGGGVTGRDWSRLHQGDGIPIESQLIKSSLIAKGLVIYLRAYYYGSI